MAICGHIAALHKACKHNVNAGPLPGGRTPLCLGAPTRGQMGRHRGLIDDLALGELDQVAARKQRLEHRPGQALQEWQVAQHL